jgi:hypothetical protein
MSEVTVNWGPRFCEHNLARGRLAIAWESGRADRLTGAPHPFLLYEDTLRFALDRRLNRSTKMLGGSPQRQLWFTKRAHGTGDSLRAASEPLSACLRAKFSGVRDSYGKHVIF